MSRGKLIWPASRAGQFCSSRLPGGQTAGGPTFFISMSNTGYTAKREDGRLRRLRSLHRAVKLESRPYLGIKQRGKIKVMLNTIRHIESGLLGAPRYSTGDSASGTKEGKPEKEAFDRPLSTSITFALATALCGRSGGRQPIWGKETGPGQL
jgi:hypothetical protein